MRIALAAPPGVPPRGCPCSWLRSSRRDRVSRGGVWPSTRSAWDRSVTTLLLPAERGITALGSGHRVSFLGVSFCVIIPRSWASGPYPDHLIQHVEPEGSPKGYRSRGDDEAEHLAPPPREILWRLAPTEW